MMFCSLQSSFKNKHFKKKVRPKVWKLKSKNFPEIFMYKRHNSKTKPLSLRWSFVHWIPCPKTHILKKKIAQKLENWNPTIFLKFSYISGITLKLSHFHLDGLLFIGILVRKHTFKKKSAQKFENWNPKIFQKKLKSRKIDFKIAITQKLRIVDT